MVVQLQRDLGVKVSSDLTFSVQIDMVVQAGNHVAGNCVAG